MIFGKSAEHQALEQELSDLCTQRDQLDAQYQECSSQMLAIMKSQAVIECKIDGSLLSANPVFLNKLGFRTNDIEGRHHSMFVDSAYAGSKEYSAMWSKLGRGESVTGESKCKTADGRSKWFQMSYSPVNDASGSPYKVVILGIDITHQKNSNVIDKNKSVTLDSVQTNVMIADHDYNITYMNETLVSLLGNAQDEIRKDLRDFDVKKLIGSNIDRFYKNPAYQRGILDGLSSKIDSQIKLGNLVFGLILTPLFDEETKKRLGTVVEWSDRTKELQSEAESITLNNVRTNIMMADAEYNITYMNKNIHEMFLEAESEIRTSLSNFDAKNLMGTNIDTFHKNPAHQRRILDALTDTTESQIKLGKRTFGLVINPVFDPVSKDRLATVVEWTDRTQALFSEAQSIALNNVRTNIMLADADYAINYLNKNIHEMFREAEVDIKTALPRFDVKSLMGTSIDAFHKNPAHQRGILDALSDTIESQIVLGKRTFGLVVNPVFDPVSNVRLATVVEWTDQTLALQAEAESIALNNVRTNIMMADASYNISYMNKNIYEMFREAEEEIRTVLPNFDSQRLVGNNIDTFHKNPAHQRRILDSLTDTVESQIKLGKRTFGLVFNPVFDPVSKKRLATVVEWTDRTKALESEAQSIALNNVRTNVMMADADYNINYLNKNIVVMFRDSENEIRKVFPDFNPDRLIGRSIDVFHKNPSYQRRVLDGLTDTAEAQINVGGRIFGLVVNPVFDPVSNERLATVVEWTDRTAEMGIRNDIGGMVKGAIEGNLSDRLEVKSNETLEGYLGGRVNELFEVFSETLQNLGGNVQRIAAATNETTTALGQVSDGAQQQKSAVNQIASALEQSNTGISDVSENTQEASDAANQTTELVDSGRAEMEEMVNIVNGIDENAKRIGKIVDVVSEIANQTNMLSLNAAIEAARVGEAGKGFAVVAEEVRKLAEHSATSVEEIAQLIQEAQDRAHAAVSTVDKVNSFLQQISDKSSNASSLLQRIAAAMVEQSASTEELSATARELNQIADSNATAAEEITATIMDLSKMANESRERVDAFKY